MTHAKEGDTVQVHYIGRLEDGTVFDSSEEREPLSFTLGAGQVIPGFEATVNNMAVGDKRSASLSPEEAYGPRREDLVVSLPRENMPSGPDPDIGQMLELHLQNGEIIQAQVLQVSAEAITIDANHVLAGQTLIFEIELVAIG